MELLKELWNDGALWAILAELIYAYQEDVAPLLQSHVRNNHEQSLKNCADRTVASVAKVADATPADRDQEMLSQIFQFATARHIPIDMNLAKSFINQAKSDFTLKGGHVAKSKSVNVNNGVITEGVNK